MKQTETVVLILTGHLLKDPDFTFKFHRGDLFNEMPAQHQLARTNTLQRAPVVIDADFGAVIAALDAAERKP